MDTDISDFGAGGCGRQNVRDILQGGGPSSDTIKIGDVGHDPKYWKYDGVISPPGSP